MRIEDVDWDAVHDFWMQPAMQRAAYPEDPEGIDYGAAWIALTRQLLWVALGIVWRTNDE